MQIYSTHLQMLVSDNAVIRWHLMGKIKKGWFDIYLPGRWSAGPRMFTHFTQILHLRFRCTSEIYDWHHRQDGLYIHDPNKCPIDRWFDCVLTLLTPVPRKTHFETLLLSLPLEISLSPSLSPSLSLSRCETIGLAKRKIQRRGRVSRGEASSLESSLFILIALQSSFVLLAFCARSSNGFTEAFIGYGGGGWEEDNDQRSCNLRNTT